MTTSTELVASVEIAHEARTERIPPGAADGAVLRVIPGDVVRVAALLGRDPKLAPRGVRRARRRRLARRPRGTHDGRTFVERGAFLRERTPTSSSLSQRIAGTPMVWWSSPRHCVRLRAGSAPPPTSSSPPTIHSRSDRGVGPANTIEALPDVRTPAGREALVARLRAVRRRAHGDVVLRDESARGRGARDGGGGQGRHRSSRRDRWRDFGDPRATGRCGHRRPRAPRCWRPRGPRRRARGSRSRASVDPRAVEAPALLERVFNRARWPDAIPASVSRSRSSGRSHARPSHKCSRMPSARMSLEAAGLLRWSCSPVASRSFRAPRSASSSRWTFSAPRTTLVSRDPGDALVAAGALAARGECTLRPSIPSRSSRRCAATVRCRAFQGFERRHRGTRRARLVRPRPDEGAS